MKLEFKKQWYQEDAVMSVVNCFEWEINSKSRDIQAHWRNEQWLMFDMYSFWNHKITLTPKEIMDNIRKVQQRNEIPATNCLDVSNFTIEMETWTWKTYTYIKTMYELNNAYGRCKFIVMVPSIAIREWVVKSFEITQEHFQEMYHKKIRFFVYNSANSSNIANINTFASDDSIQVMIINYQAFNWEDKAKWGNKRIYQELDELQSRRPIDVINSVNPILILDEPQKIWDKTEEKLATFHPLFTVRYSATHKKDKEYNKVYRLDAVDAYNERLVKKISVKWIELLHNKAEWTFLCLDRIEISKKQPVAYIEIERKTNSWTEFRVVPCKWWDDLYVKSNELAAYKWYKIAEINWVTNTVSFINNTEISVWQVTWDSDIEQIPRLQIRETIYSHLEKEKELFKKWIKVLSLFFIDEVAKYKDWSTWEPMKWLYAKMFESEYKKAVDYFRTLEDPEYTQYLDSMDVWKIHAWYFSVDKKGHEIDSAIWDKKSWESFDEDAYDLIMKNKERLLSLDEPVRFIFSHSALREWWDNPNIFQICTLKHNNSEMSKRQEIWRGLRICVDNEWHRMDYSVLWDEFHLVNSLTVVASESYENFAAALQDEISKSLSERPKVLDQTYFVDKIKTIINENWESLEFTPGLFNKLLMHCMKNEYIDDESRITDKFMYDLDHDALELHEAFKWYETEVAKIMKSMYLSENTDLIGNWRWTNIKELKPNENFYSAEFQELWWKINFKSVYTVKFESDELIEDAIAKIDQKLNIAKMQARITSWWTTWTISSKSLHEWTAMQADSSKTEVIDDFTPTETEYDLIWEITKDTWLTRKTIATILKWINPKKFVMYQYNPEEFIRKVTKLINEAKATMILAKIEYNMIDWKFDDSIFTINNIRWELWVNAIEVKKHIYDHLLSDSKVERDFAHEMELWNVKVYAKLPDKFRIPTPVWNYNPDWAIVFDKWDTKDIYFIAETKWTLDSFELKEIERTKIECARKHFACAWDDKVNYEVFNKFQDFIDFIHKY